MFFTSDILFLVTSFLFFIFIVRNILSWLYLWEKKDYNVARVFFYLKDTYSGGQILYGWGSVFKTILLIFYFFTIFYTKWYTFYPHFIFFTYLISFFLIIHEIFQRQIRLPSFTIRNTSCFILVISILLALYAIPLLDKYFWLLLLDKIVSIFTMTVLLFLGFPSDFYRDSLINKAVKKIKMYPELISIGVEGNERRTLAKIYIASVLNTRFNVLKVNSYDTTIINISHAIIKGLTPKKNVLITEIEGKSENEILEKSILIKPTIGVITGLDNSYLSVFKSMKKIYKAEQEFAESIDEDGIILFNGNNTHCLALFNKLKRKKVLYYTGYDNSQNGKAAIQALNIRVHQLFILFDLKYNRKVIKNFKVNLVGAVSLEGLLPALYLGLYYGMNFSDIKKSLEKIYPVKNILDPLKTSEGGTLINSTKDIGIDSLKYSLEYLMLYTGRKIVVFEPILELLTEAKATHYLFGKEIGKVCDYLILTNKNYYRNIKKGIDDSKGNCKLLILTTREIKNFINRNVGKKDVALFKGPGSYHPLKLIHFQEVF